jgi:hypothetical protein
LIIVTKPERKNKKIKEEDERKIQKKFSNMKDIEKLFK